ncbi:MAG: ATP-dependent sacrificial sulfur transferase LarE [Pirellulaceae bacterium]|jgi:uncharacterized protein|nr:ATP-dependent sacrificial sulfur transferase LarE [Pirellulaceae bacterium]
MSDLATKREQLLESIARLGKCAIAFSAGVDSTVVAKAAQLALGDRAVAVTAVSPSLASGELDQAKSLAAEIGIRHVLISTDEFDNPDYLRNAPDRCYHCKTELYGQLDGIIGKLDVVAVLNGANVDDATDYRPGIRAAAEHQVRSPLADCGFNKSDVRALAAHWHLPVWDKPASPCLASRVAYGEEVTADRLRMIDQGEQFLREEGFSIVRVRYHKGDLARIELAPEEIGKLSDDTVRHGLIVRFQEIGFKFITLDLQGFRSGSLNTVLPVETLSRRE